MEFFLLFTAAGVEDVRFIRGDEALKSAAGALAKAHFDIALSGSRSGKNSAARDFELLGEHHAKL